MITSMHHIRKNLDLELLRAVAILMTIAQHAEVLVFWPSSLQERLRVSLGLWAGVDLFFCISGYIITRTFLASAQSNALAWPVGARWPIAVEFWIKRVWRLWPAAWCWSAVAVLCALWFNTSGLFGQPGRMARDALAAIFQVANVHWAGCYHSDLSSCNFVDQARVNLLVPTGWALVVYWSLSLEEQFYLVTPLLMLLVPRRHLVLLLALVWLCLVPWSRPPLGVAWFFRVDALAVGVLLAFWSLRAVDASQRAPTAPASMPVHQRAALQVLSLLAMAVLAWLGAPSRAAWPGLVSALSLIAGFLVWMASLDRRLLMPTGVLGGVLTWLGARSYSMYLTHMLAYLGTRELWHRLGAAPEAHMALYGACALVLLLGLAELGYRLVEQPARRKGYRLAARYRASRVSGQGVDRSDASAS